ncbi:histone deacetylase family protein [Candidatus Thorarchaeota archaeon]|nr:MAG: histone deacetylase family protein [Candidatus Thorarchaeota archaeon]
MKIVYHPLMKESYDNTPAGATGRLDSAIQALSLVEGYECIEPEPATQEQLLLAHSPRHIDSVKRESESRHSGRLYDVALLAAGGAIKTAHLAARGEPCFGLIRPPGHHASYDGYWGFCYFCNMALALLHLKTAGIIERAFVLDFDLHHGDGNVDILSRHDGFEIYNPRGRGDEEYLGDIERFMENMQEADIIGASAGFDQYEQDWGGNLSTEAFGEIGRIMKRHALDKCDGRRFALLEGGYNHTDLGVNIRTFCNGLR